ECPQQLELVEADLQPDLLRHLTHSRRGGVLARLELATHQHELRCTALADREDAALLVPEADGGDDERAHPTTLATDAGRPPATPGCGAARGRGPACGPRPRVSAT